MPASVRVPYAGGSGRGIMRGMAYVPLITCPRCARHVRHDEATCPFCADAIAAPARARWAPDTQRRMGRAAAFVFGASMSVACGSEVEQVGEPLPPGAGGAGGQGATTSSSNATSSTSTGQGGDPSGAGGNQALYGAPAVGGGGAGGEASGAGGFSADYGAPPPP